jgi:DNA/RNA endonuclease YhcR with UshA esterase domain
MTVSSHQHGATCPSCGRFVGPVDACPYCGAAVKKRLPLRTIRIACLVLAILGIVFLIFAVSGTATPTAKIGNLEAPFNYAYVRLAGRVTRGPLYDPDSGTLRFYIADDTGELQVAAFRDVARQLIAANNVPSAGDAVTVQGTLRIRDDLSSLNLGSAEHVQLAPPTLKLREVAAIGRADELALVSVRGEVREIRQPYQGLTLYTLVGRAGEVDLAWYRDTEALYGALPVVTLGDTIEVQAIVTFYRDQPQLVLRHPTDFINLGAQEEPPLAVRIGELSVRHVNQEVQVAGRAVQITPFTQGVRITLSDGSGEIILLLWQELWTQIREKTNLTEGAQVRVSGMVDEYRGELELVPKRAADVEVITLTSSPAPVEEVATRVPTAIHSTAAPRPTLRPTRKPTAVPVRRTIASLSTQDLEAIVLVRGTIAAVNEFSRGKYVQIEDETGQIQIVLFADVLEPVNDRIAQGVTVTVRGRVNVFHGQLEVVAFDVLF